MLNCRNIRINTSAKFNLNHHKLVVSTAFNAACALVWTLLLLSHRRFNLTGSFRMPNPNSHILSFTLLTFGLQSTSPLTALSAQRYPNSLDAYELRKSATTYRRTYTEWQVLGRHASDPGARIYTLQHHPKPALRVILWNVFRRTVTAETMATVPNPCSTWPISGLG